jgi:hypothetical protein
MYELTASVITSYTCRLYDVYLCDVVLAAIERNSKWLVRKNQDQKEQRKVLQIEELRNHKN